MVQVENLIKQPIRRIELAGYEPKNRDAYIDKLHTKPSFKNRQGRRNNANEPADQAAAERRLAMMKRIKARRS